MVARGKRDGLLIAGGGLAGSLAALALARLRPEVPLLLVEESDRFGGDSSWSFFEEEIAAEHRWLVEPLVSGSWPGVYLSFPDYSRKLKLGYSSVASARVDEAVRTSLRPDQYRLNTKIVAVRENELVLTGGEKIRADGAVDARSATHLSLLEPAWRKFLGRTFHFPRPHRVDLPVLVDATVEQLDGYCFFQCLPLSEDRLFVECNLYSESAGHSESALRGRIEDYLALRGWRDGKVEQEEAGVLPIALGDSIQPFWRAGGARVAKLGIRGGFFHPSTGLALADAVRTAVRLSEQRDFGGPALHDLFEADVIQLWRKREFYRSVNMALLAAPVWERREVMAALYRLDPAVIARFHAGTPTMVDRMRISGLKAMKQAR